MTTKKVRKTPETAKWEALFQVILNRAEAMDDIAEQLDAEAEEFRERAASMREAVHTIDTASEEP